MSWKNEEFSNFKLYAVTDIKEGAEEKTLRQIEAVCQGGADIVQLRSKELSDNGLLRVGEKMRAITEHYQKLFFVNDRADLALALDADGIHLGQDDVPVQMVRQIFAKSGKSLWIGKSTHSIEQGLSALQEKPDYLGVGPVFQTPTKPGYQAVGLDYVRQAAAQIKIPFVAIGGIDASNLCLVLEAGAKKIAVVRALFDASDSMKMAQQLKEIMEGFPYAESTKH